jgi:hypothetical protein
MIGSVIGAAKPGRGLAGAMSSAICTTWSSSAVDSAGDQDDVRAQFPDALDLLVRLSPCRSTR